MFAGSAKDSNKSSSPVQNGSVGDDVGELVDDGRPGVKVKALYDYEAQEEDELNLKKGKFSWEIVKIVVANLVNSFG